MILMPRISTIRSNTIPGNDSISVSFVNDAIEYCQTMASYNPNPRFPTTVSLLIDYRSRTPASLRYRFTGPAAYPEHFTSNNTSGSVTGGFTNRVGSVQRSNIATFILNNTSAMSEVSDTSNVIQAGFFPVGGDFTPFTQDFQVEIFRQDTGQILGVTETAFVNLIKARVYMQNNTGGDYIQTSVTYGPDEYEPSTIIPGLLVERAVRLGVFMPRTDKYGTTWNNISARAIGNYDGYTDPAEDADFATSAFFNLGSSFTPSGANYTVPFANHGRALSEDGLTEPDESFRFYIDIFINGIWYRIGSGPTCIIQANTT